LIETTRASQAYDGVFHPDGGAEDAVERNILRYKSSPWVNTREAAIGRNSGPSSANGTSKWSASPLGVYLKTPADRDWQQVLTHANDTFSDMKFVDADHGCVAGGEMYCTSDGGQTWESRRVPRNETSTSFTCSMLCRDGQWVTTQFTRRTTAVTLGQRSTSLVLTIAR